MRLRALFPHLITIIVSVALSATVALAWSGPTSAPPNGNVCAPINVGTTDQIKNAGLGINSLAVFGNAILAGVSSYLNFGNTSGSGGYGIRDNAGTMEFKNTGSSWRGFLPSTGVQSITFADGTTQTTAASGVQFGSTFAVSAGGGWPTRTYQCPSNSVMVGINVTPGGSGDYVSSIVCQALN